MENKFREMLSEIISFIFDNDEEFIKQFIFKEIVKSYNETYEITQIELQNVFLSGSRVLVKVTYCIRIIPNDNLTNERKDLFLNSVDVFNWLSYKGKELKEKEKL